MKPFTYEERSPDESLCQGDILERTDALMAMLHAVHPHPRFADEAKYPLFMILTQSCDLVWRDKGCKAHYITFCVIRDFSDALRREIGKLGHRDLAKHGVMNQSRWLQARQIAERFYNNTEPGYFYLHPAGKISKPMCAFLSLPITVRARDYYDTCVKARIIGLKPVFRAKLGSLIGDIYSRVGTEDWRNQPDFDEQVFKEEIRGLLMRVFFWVDNAGERAVKNAVKANALNLDDEDAIERFIERLAPQRDEVKAAIRTEIMRLSGEMITEQIADTLTERILGRSGVEERCAPPAEGIVTSL